MVEAEPQNAPTWIALEDVLSALAAVGRSPEGAREQVIAGCADERIRWSARAPLDPPATFWRGHSSNFAFSRSDVTNRAVVVDMPDGVADLVSVTLRDVRLAREDVVAMCPEIGAAPAPIEPAPIEPAQSEPAPIEPAQSEPAQSEPAQSEPVQSEPAQSESGREDGPAIRFAKELMAAKFPGDEWQAMKIKAVRKACEEGARARGRPLPSADSFSRAMGRRRPRRR
jgi:hypothetical protein